MHACTSYVSIDILSSAILVQCYFSNNFDHPLPQEHLSPEAVGQFTHSIYRSLRKNAHKIQLQFLFDMTYVAIYLRTRTQTIYSYITSTLTIFLMVGSNGIGKMVVLTMLGILAKPLCSP